MMMSFLLLRQQLKVVAYMFGRSLFNPKYRKE